MNEIVVKFRKNFDTENVSGLRQWNYGQVLKVEGLELPDGNIEVHFSLTEYDGKAPVQMGTVQNNVIAVDIPDFILAKENVYMPTYEAYAWVYVTDGESGKTIRKIVFTIESRAEPTAGVPEPKQDEFLDEVRAIMNETKEIAQSVRDDADNGEFDGPKGEKGDAGGLRCIPCKELPTTDIIPNAYYLLENGTEEVEVKGETVVKNKYIEYMYINGEWEIIGSISIGMNLDEYVKKTDYATTSVAGLVKPNARYGTYVDANGLLSISGATADDVDAKASSTKPITPYRIDYAVMKALTDSKNHEWTEEEQANARTQIGAIGNSDFATADVGGVVKVSNLDYGVELATDGTLRVRETNEWNILNSRKSGSRSPVTLSKVDLVVKEVLKNPQVEWTEEEKASALAQLGVFASNGVLTSKDGALVFIPWAYNTQANSIVRRLGDGSIECKMSTLDTCATNKGYVDGLIGDVQSILTELHSYAETLSGGDA